jgi:hypothetical protein
MEFHPGDAASVALSRPPRRRRGLAIARASSFLTTAAPFSPLPHAQLFKQVLADPLLDLIPRVEAQ